MKKRHYSRALSAWLLGGLLAQPLAARADVPEPDPAARPVELTPNSPPDTEAQAPIGSQASAKGLLEDARFNLLFRLFADHDVYPDSTKDAWVLGNQAVFESGYTRGLVGVGFDASLFSALKLNGGNGAGNRVHLNDDGTGQNQKAWTYPGVWDVKARVSETVLKYGQQLFDDPYLVPNDNRALPPTFRGFSLVSSEIRNLTLKAASVDAVIARGMTGISPLSTEYGGVPFSRFTFAGGDYARGEDTAISLYGGRAENVWDQYFVGASHSIGDASAIRWTGALAYYYTHDVGQSRGGPINNHAYSLALSGQHGPHTVLLGYQQILSNQFFDYLGQSAGNYLVNSLDVDYNAPHEKSLQLSHTLDAKHLGVPGLKVSTWAAYGWGADASVAARRYANPASALHGLYWKNGQPVHGTHWEVGVIPSYTLASGKFKNTSVKFYYMHHQGTEYYSDDTSDVYRLMVNMPVNVF
jgi:hypothetical protein